MASLEDRFISERSKFRSQVRDTCADARRRRWNKNIMGSTLLLLLHGMAEKSL